MQVDSPPVVSSPLILDTLPHISGIGDSCPKRARVQLDMLMLAVEALDLDGSETLLKTAKELGLQDIVKGRVSLWRMRCANPLRRYGSQRRELSQDEAKALTLLVCNLARRLTALIRQLLLTYQQLSDRQLPVESSYRLAEYLERFRAHFRSRMNPKRAAVMEYADDDKLNSLALNLLNQLLFCTGVSGPQRLWFSLFDGDVA